MEGHLLKAHQVQHADMEIKEILKAAVFRNIFKFVFIFILSLQISNR